MHTTMTFKIGFLATFEISTEQSFGGRGEHTDGPRPQTGTCEGDPSFYHRKENELQEQSGSDSLGHEIQRTRT